MPNTVLIHNSTIYYTLNYSPSKVKRTYGKLLTMKMRSVVCQVKILLNKVEICVYECT